LGGIPPEPVHVRHASRGQAGGASGVQPLFIRAAYALKLGARGETYDTAPHNRNKELFVAGLATFYTVFLVFAAGLGFLLLPFIIYTPGTILFIMSRREQDRRLFSPAELVILVIAVAGFVAGITALATGAITT
jgi:arginine:ornithine antiporter/lysine permease